MHARLAGSLYYFPSTRETKTVKITGQSPFLSVDATKKKNYLPRKPKPPSTSHSCFIKLIISITAPASPPPGAHTIGTFHGPVIVGVLLHCHSLFATRFVGRRTESHSPLLSRLSLPTYIPTAPNLQFEHPDRAPPRWSIAAQDPTAQ